MLTYNGDRFGTRLRRWRGARTLRELAAEIGSSAATLSRLESGYTPDLTVFMVLCQQMGDDPREFFFEAGNERGDEE